MIEHVYLYFSVETILFLLGCSMSIFQTSPKDVQEIEQYTIYLCTIKSNRVLGAIPLYTLD